jgi:Mg-chelatase subunit ChlD
MKQYEHKKDKDVILLFDISESMQSENRKRPSVGKLLEIFDKYISI